MKSPQFVLTDIFQLFSVLFLLLGMNFPCLGASQTPTPDAAQTASAPASASALSPASVPASVPAFDSASDSNALSLHAQYVRILEPWLRAANTQIRFLTDDMAIYGLAQHGHWYMQAHDTAFCAFAVLGTDPETDEARVGMTKEEMRKTALAMLRFTLRTHLAGGSVCTDGKPWGHTWISQLGLERMSAGVSAIKPWMDRELIELYARVYASEADFLLTQKVVAGLTKNNVPESNMWKGATLVRAAALNPKHPNVAKWQEAAAVCLVNAISVPSDEKNETIVDGKRVCDRFVGANMFESGACNHHGYQNVGYMNITLSNLALIYFWCLENGATPPEALFHNALKQWKIIKAATFDDGRLLRVGGDTRIRYCYCQDYAIFCWLLAQRLFGDREAESFERGWLKQVAKERNANPDGWFMMDRLAALWNYSPLYFTRLEGDKACSLATAAYWRRAFDFDRVKPQKIDAPTSWHDDFHGAWLQKGPNRIASWAWHGAQKACGLCLPADASDLAEWEFNLAGQVFGVGVQNICRPISWTGFAFDGGFATCGSSSIISAESLAEGDHSPQVGILRNAFCALPDDRTAVVLQFAKSGTSNYLRRVRGLSLSIPNDVFNDFQRTLFSKDGARTLVSPSAPAEKEKKQKYEEISNSGNWLNIDDKLGVVAVYGGSPTVARLPEPQIRIKHDGKPNRIPGSLYCEEIAQVCSEGIAFIRENSTIFDCAAIVLTADAEETKKTAESPSLKALKCEDPDLRALSVPGADGVQYFVVVNFSEKEKSIDAADLFADADLSPIGQTSNLLPASGIGIWRKK